MKYRKLTINNQGDYIVLKPMPLTSNPDPCNELDWNDDGRKYKTERQLISYIKGELVKRRSGDQQTRIYFRNPKIRRIATEAARSLKKQKEKPSQLEKQLASA